MVPDRTVIALRAINEVHRCAYVGIYKKPYMRKRDTPVSLMSILEYKALVEMTLHNLKREVFAYKRVINFYYRFDFNYEGCLREKFKSEDGDRFTSYGDVES